MSHGCFPPGEPRWRRLIGADRAGIPPALLPWLLDTSSLTRRLIEACEGPFRVEVLRQRHERPQQGEVRALGLRAERAALVRQVRLLCAGTPWVYARTVIPPQTLRGEYRRLAHLGTRSLGAFLFSDPTLERGDVEFACLTAGDRLYPLATSGLRERPAVIWGRRSLFRIGGRPLLVSEFFLPQLAGAAR